MKVQMISPFNMQWMKGYKKVFEENHCEVSIREKPKDDSSDVMIFHWCNGDTLKFINGQTKNCKYIVFIRRYEYYSNIIEKMAWHKVDKVVMVNDFLACGFKERTGITPEVIYNGVSVKDWRYKERGHGNKIAMVGYINQKKNIPLALQIMHELNNVSQMTKEEYELHLAGGIQCGATIDYLNVVARHLRIRIYLNGQIDNINFWLEDKNYLLSTAISEGNPNNVIEAMAKGIKPIVHGWGGSKKQFGDCVFNSIEEAYKMIMPSSEYDSAEYRRIVEEKFGDSNYKKVFDVVMKSCQKEVAV